ncbi:MAG: hypothetical protein WA280_15100, partial [Xanthobacteraceae bacterium]
MVVITCASAFDVQRVYLSHSTPHPSLTSTRPTMTHPNRRRVLTSLAGGAAVAGIAPAISNEAFADSESDALCQRAPRREGWLIAQQRRESAGESIVDFWSMPWAQIPYANHLPPQIARGMVSCEEFPQRTA